MSDDLLAKAKLLDANAVEAGEETAQGRALRKQAADLRVQALGPKVYPVLVCSSCFEITGWTSQDGLCDTCVRIAQREAAYHDPHTGWVDVSDRRPKRSRSKRPLRTSVVHLLSPSRAAAQAWLSRVDPDATGPVSPEGGYQLDVGLRDQFPAADGSGTVVRFFNASERFDGHRWTQLAASKLGRSDIPIPMEFSAALPIEQLAEAWGDFRGWIDEFNRRSWAAEAEAREAARQAQAARAETLAQQQGVADMLDES